MTALPPLMLGVIALAISVLAWRQHRRLRWVRAFQRAVRALEGPLNDLSRTMGAALLPAVQRVTAAVNEFARALSETGEQKP